MLIEKSLVNCHIRGLHSLVLCENPMRRIFFTTPGHELNSPLSIAIHPHHCKIFITPLWGEIFNIIWTPNIHGTRFNEYGYTSAITSGHGSFKLVEERSLSLSPDEDLLTCETFMNASELHSIYTRSDRAAWLICEEEEDPKYNPSVYSIYEPKITEDLYKPMDFHFLRQNFRK